MEVVLTGLTRGAVIPVVVGAVGAGGDAGRGGSGGEDSGGNSSEDGEAGGLGTDGADAGSAGLVTFRITPAEGIGTTVEARGSISEATGVSVVLVSAGAGNPVEARGSIGEATGVSVVLVSAGAGTTVEAKGSLGEATGGSAVLVSADYARSQARALSAAGFFDALEISHPLVSQNVRVVADTVDHDIEGETYTALAFRSEFPQNIERQVSAATIGISNIGKPLMRWVNESRGGRGGTVRLLRVIGPPPGGTTSRVVFDRSFSIGSVRVDSAFVEVSLSGIATRGRPAILKRHDAGTSPGLF